MYRAVSQALMMETDPRENEAAVNWNMMSAGFISAKDLELIWCLIKREVRVSKKMSNFWGTVFSVGPFVLIVLELAL